MIKIIHVFLFYYFTGNFGFYFLKLLFSFKKSKNLLILVYSKSAIHTGYLLAKNYTI